LPKFCVTRLPNYTPTNVRIICLQYRKFSTICLIRCLSRTSCVMGIHKTFPTLLGVLHDARGQTFCRICYTTWTIRVDVPCSATPLLLGNHRLRRLFGKTLCHSGSIITRINCRSGRTRRVDGPSWRWPKRLQPGRVQRWVMPHRHCFRPLKVAPNGSCPMAVTAWACDKLGHASPTFFERIAQHSSRLVSDGNPQTIANTAYASAKLGHSSLPLFMRL
jgi:hypothetical protein